MKKIIFLIFLILPLYLPAQSSFSGMIKNSQTNEPLPFAKITINDAHFEMSDSEGTFLITSKKSVTEIIVSYVGFRTRRVPIKNNTKFISVKLEPFTESPTIDAINTSKDPAKKIIQKAIENKNKNNISKSLNSFEYRVYNKLLVTANPDSIDGKLDSVFVLRNDKSIFKNIDSTNYKFKNQIQKQHLYISEKVAQHKFKRGKNKKEIILGSRMAGFNDPVYEVLALNIEDLSFYDEVYTLLGTNYINPLAKNALKKYNYKILDTVTRGKHRAYIIYYKPKRKNEFVGLEGVLFINSESYAVEEGIAELKGIINVKASQSFKFLPEHQIWFPNEMQISIRKGTTKETIKLFAGALRFADGIQQNDSISTTKTKNPSDLSYLVSKSNIVGIRINEPVKIINSASTIEINRNASKRDFSFWNTYRTDTISKKGLRTFKVIDSFSKKEKIEKKLNIGRKLVKGYFPTKLFDFDLSQLINFNGYEGFRLGFGGQTNAAFSEKVRFEGYTAYGFKDTKFKYHGASSIRVNEQNNTWIGVGYTNDLEEAAKLDFLFDDTSFSLINPRNLNIGQFYNYETFEVNAGNDILPNLESKLKLSHGTYEPKFDYQFINTTQQLTNYKLTLATFAIKWTPFSRYMNSPIGKLAIKNSTPKITAQITKSFPSILKGDFNFTQINFKFEHTVKAIKNSSTSFLIQGGIISGDTPLSHLYNATPNYALKNPWRKRINFSGTNAFETMSFNEFISDTYVMLQARHNFDRFKISRKFKPRLSLISRFAIGDIQNPNFQQGVNFERMNKGYLESGFVLNHLFKDFGISSFYRYGAYSNAKFSDNLAVKLTYVLSLGF